MIRRDEAWERLTSQAEEVFTESERRNRESMVRDGFDPELISQIIEDNRRVFNEGLPSAINSFLNDALGPRLVYSGGVQKK